MRGVPWPMTRMAVDECTMQHCELDTGQITHQPMRLTKPPSANP